MKRFIASESVTEGHPDKICDQISDAVLDYILERDKKARVACECVVKNDNVIVFGEISTNITVNIENIVKDVIKEIGYNKSFGFDYNTCNIEILIDKQSPDIANLVNKDDSILGAGDQGVVFGYACDDTDTFMPYSIKLANDLSYRLSLVRKNKILSYLGPDGKTEVIIKYENDKPIMIDSIVISTQHTKDISLEKLRNDVKKYVIDYVVDKSMISNNTKYYINYNGRFVVGGPKGDSGLTGRKIIVDTYGCFSKHGGGAFSGKDPTKVDRSAAYMARYVAKNIVASGLAKKCELQLSYVIGSENPISIDVNTFNTGNDIKIKKIIEEVFDFSLKNIIKQLDLLNVSYKKLAAYGHFGRKDINCKWELLDKVDILKKYI